VEIFHAVREEQKTGRADLVVVGPALADAPIARRRELGVARLTECFAREYEARAGTAETREAMRRAIAFRREPAPAQAAALIVEYFGGSPRAKNGIRPQRIGSIRRSPPTCRMTRNTGTRCDGATL
jgi:hypothetical protein